MTTQISFNGKLISIPAAFLKREEEKAKIVATPPVVETPELSQFEELVAKAEGKLVKQVNDLQTLDIKDAELAALVEAEAAKVKAEAKKQDQEYEIMKSLGKTLKSFQTELVARSYASKQFSYEKEEELYQLQEAKDKSACEHLDRLERFDAFLDQF